MGPIRTVGHGTLPQQAFADLLREAAIDLVVDVRRYPGSRRHPHFSGERMRAWLPEHGIAYEPLPSLGGRRRPADNSPNVGLRNAQFRAYADHMAGEEFADGVTELLSRSHGHHAAVLCAESLWWRCHRRLLADHLVLVSGVAVEHLSHDGRVTAHEPTAEARRAEGVVRYDRAPDRTLFEP